MKRFYVPSGGPEHTRRAAVALPTKQRSPAQGHLTGESSHVLMRCGCAVTSRVKEEDAALSASVQNGVSRTETQPLHSGFKDSVNKLTQAFYKSQGFLPAAKQNHIECATSTCAGTDLRGIETHLSALQKWFDLLPNHIISYF